MKVWFIAFGLLILSAVGMAGTGFAVAKDASLITGAAWFSILAGVMAAVIAVVSLRRAGDVAPPEQVDPEASEDSK